MQRTTHPRIPALDGLRGLAVAGVLAYHAGFGWARGGFLGVSLFFTLSGFLICSLLVSERAATGRVDLGRFWARRARRLLPAAIAALLVVLAFGAAAAADGQLRELRGDVLAAIAYVANWRFVLDGQSYAELGQAPSPVQHFWSLAIEEQFYVVFPLVVLAARRWLPWVLGAGVVLSLGSLLLIDDPLRAYYGTDARAAELLVGALLAVWVRRAGRPGRAAALAGPAAMALLLASWAATSQSDGRLYGGGLLVHAVLVAVVIRSATGGGLLPAALGAGPLRWLGRISYGAYLYHWPLFLWFTPTRTGLEGLPLAIVRIGVSLLLAEVSYRLLEEPIRSGRRLTPQVARLSLATGAVAVAAVAIVVTPPQEQDQLAVALSAASPALVAPSTTVPVSTTTSTTLPVGEVRPWLPGERLQVYVAGDSNAFGIGFMLAKWAEGRGIDIWTSGWFACHLVRGGEYRYAGETKATDERCNRWIETRSEELAEIRPHLTLVIYGSFDVLDRRLPGSDSWRHVGQPAYDRMLRREMERLTDMARAAGSRVMWSTYPAVRTGTVDGVPPERRYAENDPERVNRLNRLIRSVAASRPGTSILELRHHLQSWPGGELDPERRPDGVHPSWAQLGELVQWIGPQLVDVVRGDPT